jgi:LmbE family N-acetylglucosaminyl deacetylase
VSELHAEIVSAIQRYRPDAVITFAEDGLYWHLDHIGVHERTYTAVRSLGAEAPPLYYVTMQHGVMREVVNAAHAKGGAPPDSSFWGIAPDAFGDSAKPPSFVIDVRDWVPRKLAALRCHRTQMGPNNPMAWINDEEARQWLGIEQFRRAALDTAGDGMLEHLGEIQHAD